MQIRYKKRRQPVLLISSVAVLTLALLAGAVFFLLPKVTAAHTNQSTSVTRQANNVAHTINTATKISKVSNVAAQPTQSIAASAKTGSQPAATGNTPQSASTGNSNTSATNNANQTTGATTAPPQAQSSTVPLVTLKQYVPNIRHMVAQTFNITDAALAQDLQSGMHLANIATQHGLSNTQLQTLLSSSITTSFQPAISDGSLTQAQVSSFIQQAQQNPTTLEQQLSILAPQAAHW